MKSLALLPAHGTTFALRATATTAGDSSAAKATPLVSTTVPGTPDPVEPTQPWAGRIR